MKRGHNSAKFRKRRREMSFLDRAWFRGRRRGKEGEGGGRFPSSPSRAKGPRKRKQSRQWYNLTRLGKEDLSTRVDALAALSRNAPQLKKFRHFIPAKVCNISETTDRTFRNASLLEEKSHWQHCADDAAKSSRAEKKGHLNKMAIRHAFPNDAINETIRGTIKSCITLVPAKVVIFNLDLPFCTSFKSAGFHNA